MYSQPTVVCYGTTKTYTVDTADGLTGTSGSTYNWVVTGTGYAGDIIGNKTNSIKVDWKTTPTGSYTITVTETNNGCLGTDQTLNVTIKDNPIISSADVEVCAGLTKEISAKLTSGDADGTYTWTVPIGAKDPGNESSFLSGTSGIYTVTYKDTDFCISNISTAILTVNPLPSATITPSTDATTTFCAGGSVLLSAPTGLDYVWYKDGSALTPTLINYVAVDSGSYTVKTTDSKSCTNNTATPTVVTVNPLPVIAVLTSGDLEFCDSKSVTLTADPSGATAPYTYQWKNKKGLLALKTSSTYTASTTDNYSVTVTDSKTCFATSSEAIVTVHPNPAPVISTLTPLSFCAGESVLLYVNTGANYSYQWKDTNGDITTAGGTATPYNAIESSVYSVKIVDNTYKTACATTSLPVTVTKKVLPVTSIIGY